jgi:4-hydroxybenzoate polyprenyltransferase
MRQSLWSAALVGLALGSLSIVGGTAIGGEIGPLAVGYGLLVILAALYLLAGLAIRQRVWRRINPPKRTALPIDRLAGRRVF